jgi:hypothetical protein
MLTDGHDELLLMFTIVMTVLGTCCFLLICRVLKPDFFDDGDDDQQQQQRLNNINLPELPPQLNIEGEPEFDGERSPLSSGNRHNERSRLLQFDLDEEGELSDNVPHSASIYQMSPAARNTNYVTREDELPPTHDFPFTSSKRENALLEEQDNDLL